MEWVERYVARLRTETGVPGASSEEGLARCVEQLPEIRLCYADVETAFCMHRHGGGAVITLPLRLRAWEWERTLCHELGHATLTRGMHRLLSQMGGDDPRLQRLARMWKWKEERIARAFAAAWLGE